MCTLYTQNHLMSSFGFRKIMHWNQNTVDRNFRTLLYTVELHCLVVLPEVTAGEVGFRTTTDFHCKEKLVVPGLLGVLADALVLTDDFWMCCIFKHECIIYPKRFNVNRRKAPIKGLFVLLLSCLVHETIHLFSSF